MNHIGDRPTPAMYETGMDIDCQCARCGSTVHSERCEYCEDGFSGHDCGEEWRPVVGGEGRYEISSLGRVKSLLNRYGHERVMFLSTWLSSGYPTTAIRKRDWKRSRPVAVHVLIAEAFLGPCPEGHEVNHKDFNRANSVLSNLEYTTYSENNLHAFRHGRQPARGERVGAAKLTEADVVALRQSKETHVEAARRIGVHPSTVLRARSGEFWGHVKGDKA